MTPEHIYLAVRMANEGIPVAAIARSLSLPLHETRRTLELAKDEGLILELPQIEWPADSTRMNRRPVDSSFLAVPHSYMYIASAFGITPGQAKVVEQLIRYDICLTENLLTACSPNGENKVLQMHICRIRRKISWIDVETLWGVGYRISRTHAAMLISFVEGYFLSSLPESKDASVS